MGAEERRTLHMSLEMRVNHTMVQTILLTALAALVPLVVIANTAVEAVPHPRGIGFSLPLRYALLTPTCALASVAAAAGYAFLRARSETPALMLAGAIVGAAVLALWLMGALGPAGLTRAAAPAVVASAVTLGLLVPRFAGHPPRVFGAIALSLFGAVEAVLFVLALRAERSVPVGPDGLAFEVPRDVFDVDHKFLDLPSGARIHYIDEGQGPTLLFLHGNPAWSFQWRDLIVGLRGSFRCVALDYPGFGLSMASAGFGFTPREQSHVVEEFVDRLQLKDVTLVVQDWGGPIGLGLAGRRPELVRQVVLGATWVSPTTTSEARGKFSLIAGGPVGEFAQVNFNALAAFALKNGVVRELPPAVRDVYLRPFQPLDRRGIAAFYPGQITAATDYFTEVEGNLHRLADKKALIFWALKDPGGTRADLEGFEATFPNHKTIELPDASHFFFEDAVDLMIPEIRTFASSGPMSQVAR
jgi:pimeloyl-ACP methyl ester carboxylesterase